MSELSSEIKSKIKFLREKTKQTGEILYDRLVAAHEVYSDIAWVESVGGYKEALLVVKEEFLPDLCFATNPTEIFTVLAMFPKKSMWAKHQYNFRRLYAEWETTKRVQAQEDRLAQGIKRRTVTLAMYQELENENQDLKYKLREANREIQELRDQISTMRKSQVKSSRVTRSVV